MPRQESRIRDLSVLVLGLSLLVLASPLRLLWARDDLHWTVPFVVWGGLIALGGLAVRRREP